MVGNVLLILRILLAASLYAFLLFALWLLWKDLRAQSQLSILRQALPITLVMQGEEGAEESFCFSAPEVILGRDQTCELRVEDKTVSAQHARLSFHHHQWWIEDLHSKNGTFLNALLVTEPTVVTSGDELRCGQVTFHISIEE